MALLLPLWPAHLPAVGKISGLILRHRNRTSATRLAAAMALAMAAAGCSASHLDSIPNWAGGEPQGTPQRPTSEMEYPPVHDRPPPPATKIISVEEQTKIEKELATSREAQAKRAEQMKKDRASMLADKPKPPKRAEETSAE